LKPVNVVIILAFLTAVAAGCLSGLREDNGTVGKIVEDFDGEPVVPRSANRLFIVPPANTTGREDLSLRLMSRLREHISLDGRLGVESDESDIDLRLEIRIAKFFIEKLAYDEIGRAVKKRMWITADVRLLNIHRKKVIFYENDIQAFRVFSELTQPIETEDRSMENVLDDLAKRITSKTVTGWYTDQMTIIEKRKP
jgi:hypothetical protein